MTTAQTPGTNLRCFKPYPEYKNSGVDWLGDIPAHWDTRRLKYVAPPSDERALESGDLPYVGLEHVESGTGRLIQSENGAEAAAEAEGVTSVFRPGDVLFGKLRPYLAKVLRPDFEGRCSTELLVLRANESIEPSFLAYELRSRDFIGLINAMTYGAKMPRANTDQVTGQRVPVPPLDEQRAIAAFLDRETAKIDVLVAQKKRLIALLQEQRTALITRAVTRGLDPNVPMKDSGVEWLGKIPAHWEVKRIAMTSHRLTNGYVGPTRDILVDDGVRYLQSLHIKNGAIDFERRPYFVERRWSDQHARSILGEGDVLIVQTGDIGQVCAVPRDFAGSNCHALIILRPNLRQASGAFIALTLQSHYGQAALRWSQTGALHPHLECGHVREIRLVLPPLAEQTAIIGQVESRALDIDDLIREVQFALQRLSDLRAALISAAVTGKIDLREEVA